MKILQLVQQPQRRGAEVFAFQLAEALEREGHSSPIAYLYPGPESGALPLRSGDRVLSASGPGREGWGLDWSLFLALRELVRELAPDVIQLNGARTVKYGALLATFSPRRRWGLLYRNIGDPASWVRGPLRRLVFRRLVIPRMDAIVAVSQVTLGRLREFYGQLIPAQQIPRGVDLEALGGGADRITIRESLPCEPEDSILVCAGALGPEKRLERALTAVADLRGEFPALRLWFVGDGPLRPDLEQRADELGIADRVHFLGIRERIGEILRAADLLVLTSDTEGIPGVILEAAAVGRPAVATRVGGVPECVKDGETGLLVSPGDHSGLIAAIRGLLESSDRRARLGAAARTFAVERFDLSRIRDAYVKTYERIAGRPNRVSTGTVPRALRGGSAASQQVVFVIEGMGQGGTERSVAESLPPLRSLGFETTLVCLFRRSGALEEVLAEGFEVRFLPTGWLRRWRALRAILRQVRPSIVHTALPTTDVLGRLAAWGLGIPVLTSIVLARYGPDRTLDPRLRPWPFRALRAVDGWTARHLCHHFHAVSEAAKKDAEAALGLPGSSFTVIPRGRSASRLGEPSPERRRAARERLGLSERQAVLVNLGRQVHAKGQRYLVAATRALMADHPELQCLIAGRAGPESAELEEAISAAGLEGTVQLLGYRPDAPEILAAADIFVFPSLYEGMPGALIEALALGLPIVAFDIPPVREVVRDNTHALLVPVGDSAKLARGVHRLLVDPALAREMGETNRRHFERDFTLERSVERLAGLYQRITSSQ